MNNKEAQEVLARALAHVRELTYEDLLSRAPLLKRRTRLLGITLSQTFTPVEGGYTCHSCSTPSGAHYNVATEVYWSDYDKRVIGVQVCVDDGGESARRPLCENLEYDPPYIDTGRGF